MVAMTRAAVVISQGSTPWNREQLTAAETTAPSTAPSSGAVGARPLHRRRQRPYELFVLPAVYQAASVSILRGRRRERVGEAAARISCRPWRRESSRRGNLRLNGTDNRSRGDGQRHAH